MALPLLLSLYFAALYLPVKPVDAVMFKSRITNVSLWGHDFFHAPVMYALKYIGLNAVYGGIFAVTSLFLSFFLKSRFTVWNLLLILNLFSYYMLVGLFPESARYIPYFFLNAEIGPEITVRFLGVVGGVFLVISLVGFLILGKKDEIF